MLSTCLDTSFTTLFMPEPALKFQINCPRNDGKKPTKADKTAHGTCADLVFFIG